MLVIDNTIVSILPYTKYSQTISHTHKIETTYWKKEIISLKKQFPILSIRNINKKNYVDPYYFFNQLSHYIKKNSVLIPDASANLIWAYQAFKLEKKINMFTAFNHSPMGYAIAASVGAFFGDKKKVITATIVTDLCQ